MKSCLPCWIALIVATSFSPSLRAATCSISAPGLAFGNYDPTSAADVTGIGSGIVDCSYSSWADLFSGFTVTISLSPGSSGSYATRTLKQGMQSLGYNLYLNPGASGTIFGDGSAGTGSYALCYPGLFVTCTGNAGQSGQPFTVPVYGRLPAGQDIGGGSYIDTLIETVTF